MRETFSILAGILMVVGFVPYVKTILRRETRPAKASWLIWASTDIIIVAGMYAENAVNGHILGAVIGSSIITALSFKYGTPGWTKIDKSCLIGSLLGIILWQILDNPIVGIISSLCVVSLGSIPTLVSMWKYPDHEDTTTWTIFLFSSICAVIAIPHWTIANAAQPIVFLAINIIMMCILTMHARQDAPS